MASNVIERQAKRAISNAIEGVIEDKAVDVVKGINRIAAKQGGDSLIDNYRLLGKRALVTLGVVMTAVQVASSIVSYVVARRNEEQRIEKIVRRVLEEERQREAAK
jgi:hypothetical protein